MWNLPIMPTSAPLACWFWIVPALCAANRLNRLNAGLKALEKELKEDIDASSRVQLLIIKAFGKDEAVISSDWIDAMNFTAPEMEAGGLTPLGKAMELALQKM